MGIFIDIPNDMDIDIFYRFRYSNSNISHCRHTKKSKLKEIFLTKGMNIEKDSVTQKSDIMMTHCTKNEVFHSGFLQ